MDALQKLFAILQLAAGFPHILFPGLDVRRLNGFFRSLLGPAQKGIHHLQGHLAVGSLQHRIGNRVHVVIVKHIRPAGIFLAAGRGGNRNVIGEHHHRGRHPQQLRHGIHGVAPGTVGEDYCAVISIVLSQEFLDFPGSTASSHGVVQQHKEHGLTIIQNQPLKLGLGLIIPGKFLYRSHACGVDDVVEAPLHHIIKHAPGLFNLVQVLLHIPLLYWVPGLDIPKLQAAVFRHRVGGHGDFPNSLRPGPAQLSPKTVAGRLELLAAHRQIHGITGLVAHHIRAAGSIFQFPHRSVYQLCNVHGFLPSFSGWKQKIKWAFCLLTRYREAPRSIGKRQKTHLHLPALPALLHFRRSWLLP